MVEGLPRLRATALCLLWLTLSPPTAWTQTRLTEPIGRRVVTAEMIRDAGVTRLGDVLTLAEGWGVTSVEGFTWQPSARGLTGYGQATWSVMVDGQEMDLNLFGVQSLNRLPVTLEEIDSIAFVSHPALLNGSLVRAGAINVYTHRPGRGLSLRSRFATANETGDPGPYKYTDRTSPNIDRIGTGISGWATYAGSRASLTASGNWQEHFVTDPRIRVRNQDITVGVHPIIKQGSVSLRGRLETGNGSHTIFFGQSWIRDYFFLKQYGREVPVQSPYTHVGLNGLFALSDRSEVRYRVAYSSNALDRNENSLNIDFDWRLARWSGAVEAVRRRAQYEAALGVSLERLQASTGYALSRDDVTLATAFGTIEYRLGWSTRQAVTLAATAGEDDVALAAILAHRWLAGDRRTLDLVLSYSERLPEQDSRIWLWHRRGYRFLPDNGVTVTFSGEPRAAETLTADIGWKSPLNRRIEVELGGYLRSHSRLLLEAQPYSFDVASHAFAGPVSVVADQSGDIAGGELAVMWEATPSLDIRTYYRYQDAVAGSELFKRTWRTVPRHLLHVTAQYAPWPSVGIRASAHYRSSTDWQDYAAAAGQTDGLYSSRVDDVVNLDLALQKWLWARRARLQLLFYNLLDDAVPYHPIGAAYSLSVAVQGEVFLEAQR